MKKSRIITVLAALLCLCFCVPAAAEDLDITDIRLRIDYDTFVARESDDIGNVKVTALDDRYTIEDTAITNQPLNAWTEGTRPNLKIVLTARSPYLFSGSCTKSDAFHFEGSCDFSSASRSNKHETLTVRVRLDEVMENDDDDEDDDGPGSSAWRADVGPGSPGGAYGAYGPGAGSGTSEGMWIQNNNGWWFCNPDRTYPRNDWKKINGYWYFFNADGYMQTGWILWKNAWYFCGPYGNMYENQWTTDGYYVGQGGVWVSNIPKTAVR